MDENKLIIEGMEPCPHVDFDFSNNRYSISGTCYPENTLAFFDPIYSRFEQHVDALSGSQVVFELKLSYFNSGASRVFSQFFDMLERCASAGNTVIINWFCEDGDDNMIELAHVFEEDFQEVNFQVVIEKAD